LLGSRAIEVVNGYRKRGNHSCSPHFNAPHWPWELLGRKPSRNACTSRQQEPFPTMMRHPEDYQRMIEAMDRQIGRVLQALDPTGNR